MDFTPNPDEYLHFQEQKLMKRETMSLKSNSNQNELSEFGSFPQKIFYDSSFANTCCDWIDDPKLLLNHGSPDYMCDFLEDDFMYLNGLITADDPMSDQITMAANKSENNAPLPKLRHGQNGEVTASAEIVAAVNNNPKELGKAAGFRKKERKSSFNKGANASALKVDEIQKYFDMPISLAAKKMNVGLTVLKKRCRELNIMRWPHRKIMSLNSLINNVKELGLEKELEKIEEHKMIVEKMPHVELTDTMKKLRQACFKAKYKKKKQLMAAGRLH